MKNYLLLLLFIVELFLCSCVSKEETKSTDPIPQLLSNFTDATPQVGNKRTIESIEPSTIIDLDFLKFRGATIYPLHEDGTAILKRGFNLYKIRFDSSTLVFEDSLFLNKGNGPREFQHVTWLAPNQDGSLVIADEITSKIVERKNGFEPSSDQIEYVDKSFHPHRIAFVGNSLVGMSARNEYALLQTVDIQKNTTQGWSYKNNANTIQNYTPLRYEGKLFADGEYAFFTGFSEPVIKKFDSLGKLIYSRSTIDNYDTSINYFSAIDGDFKNYKLSNYALLSTWGACADKDYLYVIPIHNGDPSYTYIDVYQKETGDYVKSFDVGHYSNEILVQDGLMFLIATYKDSLKTEWRVYEL